MEVQVNACSMLVAHLDLTGEGGSPVYWSTMPADIWLKKTEL